MLIHAMDNQHHVNRLSWKQSLVLVLVVTMLPISTVRGLVLKPVHTLSRRQVLSSVLCRAAAPLAGHKRLMFAILVNAEKHSSIASKQSWKKLYHSAVTHPYVACMCEDTEKKCKIVI
jgi:hypothetical protein